MIAQEQARWQPLGTGRIAPQGSVADRALADRMAAYKRQVAGRYRSVSPADLASALPAGPYITSPKLDGETWFVRVAGGATGRPTSAHVASPAACAARASKADSTAATGRDSAAPRGPSSPRILRRNSLAR